MVEIRFDPLNKDDVSFVLTVVNKKPVGQSTLSASCADCNRSVPQVVVDFCNRNRDRFDNKVLCKKCQEGYKL